MEPKVSIIVPIYGVEKYLDRCMNSLLNQTLDDIEIIMVDDESKDNCPLMCDEYSKKYSNIKVIHKKNGGLGLARNSGLDIATGKYVAFIDSDDYAELDMFEKLYNFAEKNSLDTVIAGFNRTFEDGRKNEYIETDKELIFREKNELKQFVSMMLGTSPDSKEIVKYEMSVWRGIYSRNVLEKNNIRFYSERQYISEDIMYHLDYFNYANSLGVLPVAVYNYCYNSSSLTHVLRLDRFEKNVFLFEAINEKLLKYEYMDEAYEHVRKMLMYRTKGCIANIVNYKDMNKKQKMQYIGDILNNKVLREVLEIYPISKMNLKRRIFFYFMKMKCKQGIFLLVKLEDKF